MFFLQGGTSVDNAANGWITADFSGYTSRLPIDPVNVDPQRYYYIHNGSGYELNAVLEVLEFDLNTSDGGDDDARYELGNNLTLISP